MTDSMDLRAPQRDELSWDLMYSSGQGETLHRHQGSAAHPVRYTA